MRGYSYEEVRWQKSVRRIARPHVGEPQGDPAIVTLAKEHTATRAGARSGGFVVKTVREARGSFPWEHRSFEARATWSMDTAEGVLIDALVLRKGLLGGGLDRSGDPRDVRRKASGSRASCRYWSRREVPVR
jgi:hypothetical protein